MAGRTADNYLRLLQSLLPKGAAWNKDEGSWLTIVLQAMAEEFVRIEARQLDLINEADVRVTDELLTDHETDYGIPGGCYELESTLAKRRDMLLTRLRATGSQLKAYFIGIVFELTGWDSQITEYTPFWSGVGACGDPCGDQDVISHWRLGMYNAGETIPENVRCLIEKFKPAHTMLEIGGAGAYDWGFSNAFDAYPISQNHLEGAFDRSFSQAFDVRWGGAFSFDEFGNGFDKPG